MEKPVIFDKKPIVLDTEPGTYYWCACGKSANQPFCDSSHKGSGFTPVKVEVTEKKKLFWCACKNSSHKPFCDGTHKSL